MYALEISYPTLREADQPCRYGPIFLGVVINILLYGIMTTQTYLYFATFRNDRLWMKVFVGVLFVADTANTVFDTVFLYERLIANYSTRKLTIPHSWTLIRLRCVPCVAVGGLATAIACGIVTQFQEFHKFQSVVIVWLVGAAVADVAIAIALVSHLRTHRTGFVATDDIITRLTRMTVSTGAITAVCATVDLIAFLASTSGLHLVFNMPLAKLYTNSLLSS
ncbi:hypothetical protein PUNSTDRAFT_67542 [Punctularia strigosozonata HHB-11173 SS5]|uniref:uncharacterized protein n=1 Tax=Punctularia strigosozonata (strain HHB-11173) TaxID=741275 RepID=UPI0004417603|nr:uncharacterized protein PUNSTDRAFT_67542 [Punctularia strigosozonata HHB-11173 SS5]EIN09264.1 hypothetical protein PUNSTDRAFT_67542 [Punctularia strigosozonata HHB-11173 SS5]